MASLQPVTGPLGQRRAAHLLRRITFRYTRERVDQLALMDAASALSALLALQPQQQDQPYYDDPATSGMEKTPWILPPGLPLPPNTQDFQLRRPLFAWWMHEALMDPGAGHKMQFFLHQFNAVAANTRSTALFFDHLALLRWGALGNFKRFITKMILDNVMLAYLNNNENTVGNPNQNFAREFFELFTIGKGPQTGPGNYTNYTEDDVVAAARVFTGLRLQGTRATLDAETGIPRGTINTTLHDKGEKIFSTAFQGKVIAGGSTQAGIMAEIQELVDMVFAQPETARHTVRRLYRYVVHRNIPDAVEADIIRPLADQFMSSGYELKPVLSTLLASAHFYDEDDDDPSDDIIGGIIKSPLELTLQALSFFQVPIPNFNTQPQDFYNRFWAQAIYDRMLLLSGLPLFMPTDVAGYPGYYQEPDYSRQWFNSSTIISRYKLPAMLLTGRRQMGNQPNTTIGTRLVIAPWVRNSGVIQQPRDPEALVRQLLEYLLPEAVDADRFDYFYHDVFLDHLPPADWVYEWDNYLQTNNATEVTLALERLIQAILYAPEYQTC
jgi:uncharacterized protein (DUF1800 family)